MAGKHKIQTNTRLDSVLGGGVTRSMTRFFSKTAPKSAHLKPIKCGRLPFGAYFKG